MMTTHDQVPGDLPSFRLDGRLAFRTGSLNDQNVACRIRPRGAWSHGEAVEQLHERLR